MEKQLVSRQAVFNEILMYIKKLEIAVKNYECTAEQRDISIDALQDLSEKIADIPIESRWYVLKGTDEDILPPEGISVIVMHNLTGKIYPAYRKGDKFINKTGQSFKFSRIKAWIDFP